MNTWVATREELREDWERMVAAHNAYTGQVGDCDLTRYNDATHPSDGGPSTYRIAFHDTDQEALKVITPSTRYLWALMVGGYVQRKRWLYDDPETGRPVFTGTDEIMGPMTEREAVEFLAWSTLPVGCNHWQIITTEDLPRTRVFRNAWKLAA